MNAFICGTGAFLPETVVTNEDLAPSLGLDPSWIYKASGIRNRRWATKGTTTSTLAARALELALLDAARPAESIDYLLFGTMTPDRFVPGSATAVQIKLGLREIPCLDIHGACCNPLYGLQLATSLIKAETARCVAVCMAEIQSAWLRLTPDDGTTSMLFGDGAAAMILSHEDNGLSLEVLDVLLMSNGSFIDDLGIKCPGTEFGNTLNAANNEQPSEYFPQMKGQSVILQASRRITSACQMVMQRNNISIHDVRWIVPHQANLNLLTQIARSLNFNPRDGIISVLEELGNTSSASMGIALDVLLRSDRVTPNDLILLPGFGAGFTWGAALCRAGM
jgi:3-oxoacyl-[acyl-carrier-protein] synthase III